MKTAIKHENDKFMVITLKYESGLTVVENRTRTPKLWPITHRNIYKRENDEFLVINLKHVSSLTVIINLHGTPKLWSIAH